MLDNPRIDFATHSVLCAAIRDVVRLRADLLKRAGRPARRRPRQTMRNHEFAIVVNQGGSGNHETPPSACQDPLANQLSLVLHTGAYWLMLALRDAIPGSMLLARAEFATLRLRLLKVGARVIEKAALVDIHFTSTCPDGALFRLLTGRIAAAGP